MEYIKLKKLLENKIIFTISPTYKLKNDEIFESGKTPVISQDREEVNGYSSLVDNKLICPPYLLFGDHTEIFKWCKTNFIQGADGLKIIDSKDKEFLAFLYYALKTCYYPSGFYERHYSKLVKTKIPVMAAEKRKNLLKILSAYDRLIENNNKRIAVLEQEAEELYKEWFVRFRYPGNEKTLLKNTSTGLSIPETFEIKPISSVLSYYIGGGWGNDDFTNEYSVPASVIRGADFPNVINGCYTKLPYRYHKKSNHKSRILKKGDIIFEISGGTVEQPVGRSIYVTKGLIEANNNNAICASFCKLLRCNDSINSEYFYYWLKFLYDTRIIDRYQLQSTGIINFNFEFFLRKGFVMVPSKEVMIKFSKEIISFFNLIDALGKENYLLSTQRDYLLPRLMSGKLEVK